MEKDKKPASEETRKALFENMGKTIYTLNPVLKAQIILTEALNDKIENSVLSTEKEKILSVFLSLGNYSQYMNIELLSVLKSCFRAKHLSERRYNLKFINIEILEGYKHLYDVDNTGVETFFRKYIQPIVEKANDEVIHE